MTESAFMQGAAVDEKKAFEYFLQAASHGLASAQVEVGDYYRLGGVVVQDLQQAVYWYKEAADQGDAIGQYHLGMCFKNGWVRSIIHAVGWLTEICVQPPSTIGCSSGQIECF